MTINILMPALSPTMTEGKLANWLKKEGEAVKAGDVIAEIETDKATMEVEAVDEGILGKILIPAGTDGVKVNELIAVLLEDGEDSSAIGAAPAAKPVTNGAAKVEATAAPVTAAPAGKITDNGARVFATPLARRIANDQGVTLQNVVGTGPNGRIIKIDVEAAMRNKSVAPVAAAPAAITASTPVSAPAVKGPDAKKLSDAYGMAYDLVPNSKMRQVIARRLSESKQTVPHFYLSLDCELDALLALRQDLNGRSPEGKGSYKLSVNDFIIKAVAASLIRVPAANSAYTDEAALFYKHADISVAVATPTGLITPIIKKAETKGLATISSEMKDLAVRARDGKLKPEEFQGGSFSISNLGMFGVKEFAAIINPPQACILAVGAGEQRAVVRKGALAIANVMTVTLSVDHRVVDGAVGAEFLAEFKKIVEDPIKLVL
jgi:pyruvate dehydrogenase E2 component (dihydrolipoamide acetyltransferase)